MTRNTRENTPSSFRIAVEGEHTKYISFETKERGKTKIDFLNNSPIDRNDSCETRKVRILELISLCRFCQHSLHYIIASGGSIIQTMTLRISYRWTVSLAVSRKRNRRWCRRGADISCRIWLSHFDERTKLSWGMSQPFYRRKCKRSTWSWGEIRKIVTTWDTIHMLDKRWLSLTLPR